MHDHDDDTRKLDPDVRHEGARVVMCVTAALRINVWWVCVCADTRRQHDAEFYNGDADVDHADDAAVRDAAPATGAGTEDVPIAEPAAAGDGGGALPHAAASSGVGDVVPGDVAGPADDAPMLPA
jgi:hypothetical protein